MLTAALTQRGTPAADTAASRAMRLRRFIIKQAFLARVAQTHSAQSRKKVLSLDGVAFWSFVRR
jgi:hypothetical protein